MSKILIAILVALSAGLPSTLAGADLGINDKNCQAQLSLIAKENAEGVEIECAHVCVQGFLELSNAFFDSERASDSRIQIKAEDDSLVKTLVDLSDAPAKHLAPVIGLGGGDSAGRRFMVKLPPGKYTAVAEYYGRVWEKRDSVKVRKLVMAANCSFVVENKAPLTPVPKPVPDPNTCPLKGTVAVGKARLTASQTLDVKLKLVNVSENDAWGFNLDQRCSSDHCTLLVLESVEKNLQFNLLEHTVGPVTRTTAAHWQVLPPGGFFTNQMMFPVSRFTIEQEVIEGRSITPFGKFSLELRLHAAMFGKPPRGVLRDDEFPERVNQQLTYSQWRHLVPGEEIFRSKQAEFEVVME